MIDWKKRRAYQKAWTVANRDHVRRYWQQWRLDNIEKVRKASRDSKRRARIVEKQLCVIAYGGKCVCCGELEPGFLTIDHIDGKGARHRRHLKQQGLTGSFMYRWLREHGYPKDNYQLLCYNCNCGRHCNQGICPHKMGDI